ncbi:MAG: chorismate synthase [Treponema sp.]|jgi:chorismate synthase|nr:chorismate synthase [Treponema sp.]
MAGNSFGVVFRVTTFGESHGPALGCVVDGCPAEIALDGETIAAELRRRRPGMGGPAATARSERDEPELLSGVFEGKTLGTPIAIIIRNKDPRPGDYAVLKDLYRPGHADWTWEAKYGLRDHRGGGRASGRETAGRVAAGAVAKAFLASPACRNDLTGGGPGGVSIRAWVSQAAGIDAPQPGEADFDLEEAERNPLRVPGRAAAERIGQRLAELAEAGDSAGGIVSCRIGGLPPGLGEPVFGKLGALLGQAVLSIGACKGVEFGEGFAAAVSTGSAHNDSPAFPPFWDGAPGTGAFKTNHSGGTLGGISTGMDVVFRAAFKPPASIPRGQITVNRAGEPVEAAVRGRHDLCIAPRAAPVVEAMSALVVADLLLLRRRARPRH